MDAKLKHLELIQGVINRLASDSFRMKGWTVVLLAALFILLARHELLGAATIALLPILAFWGLDGYFLWQERLFRAHYDHVRKLTTDEIDFSMDISPYKDPFPRTWLGATISRTLLTFYGALIATVFAATLVLGTEIPSAQPPPESSTVAPTLE